MPTKENPLREKLGAMSPSESLTWLNFLVYGEPGAGKTHLLGTAEDHPDTQPLLILDVDGGVTTIRKRQGVDVIQVRSIDQLVAVHKELHENPGYYKTVGIDSLSELQKLDMRVIMKEAYDRKPETTDIDVPSQREWGKSGEHIRRIVRGFRDLECNTIMTAHLHTDRDQSTNVLMRFPSLPGKLRFEVPGFLDVVGLLHVEVEGTVISRKLQVAKTQGVIAKDRTGELGDVVMAPTIPMLWTMIHGEDGQGNDGKNPSDK